MGADPRDSALLLPQGEQNGTRALSLVSSMEKRGGCVQVCERERKEGEGRERKEGNGW